MPVLKLRPYKTGEKDAWEKLAAGTVSAETRKAGEASEAELAAHDEGKTAPSQLTGVKSKSKVAESPENAIFSAFGEARAKLPVGAKLTGITVHVYGKAAKSEANVLEIKLLDTDHGTILGTYQITSTTVTWYPSTGKLTLTEKQKTELTEKLTSEGGMEPALQAVQLTNTANRSEIFKWYIDLEYEEGEASFSGTATQRIALTQTVTGYKQAASTATHRFALADVFTGGKVATGTLLQRLGLGQAAPGRKEGLGTSAQRTGFSQARAGRKEGVGQASQGVGFGQAASGRKQAFAQLAQSVGLRQAFSGFKQTAGAVSQRFGFGQFVSTASEIFTGTITQSLAFVQRVTGRKEGTSSQAQRLGFRQQAPVGSKTTTGTAAQQAALGQRTQGFKQTTGTSAQRMGLGTAGVGRKVASGVARLVLGLVQRVTGSSGGESALQPGDPYEGYPRSPDAGLSPQSTAGSAETKEV